MDKEENKFLPTLVNKIKYTKKVRIADIKTYLVDEYNLTKTLNKENKNLRKSLEKACIVNQKYDLALITIDEYKTRLKDKDEEINDLEKQISKLKQDIKIVTNERNDLKLRTKNINLEVEKIKKDGLKEYKKNKIKEISNLKGHISKDKIIGILKGEPNNE